jgi:hypothetical protein
MLPMFREVVMIVMGQQIEFEEFRLVLILSWSDMVLIELKDGAHRLPRVCIPKWTRTARQLGETILKKWGVRSIVIDVLPGSRDLPPCAVIEIRTRAWRFVLHGFVPVHVDDLSDLDLTDIEHFAIRGIIARDAQGRGPFSRLGWVEEAQAWIRENIDCRRTEFNEDIRQFSAGGFFALVHFGTNGGQAYWLKATSAPNEHEFRVTQTIARYCPRFLPPLIAARIDWNAWVT